MKDRPSYQIVVMTFLYFHFISAFISAVEVSFTTKPFFGKQKFDYEFSEKLSLVEHLSQVSRKKVHLPSPTYVQRASSPNTIRPNRYCYK